MKKTAAALFVLFIALILLCSCSSSKAELSGTLKETVEKACSVADFSNVVFNYKSDEYSEEILMYMYGVEDGKELEAIDDFVLSERSGMSASTFSVIRFKSGTDRSLIESVKSDIESNYVQSLIDALMPYDPVQYEIAKKYRFETIGDCLVLVIHEKTDDVLQAIVE